MRRSGRGAAARSASTSISTRASRRRPPPSTRASTLIWTRSRRPPGAGELSHDQKEGLRADLERLRTYFDSEFSREGAHGFAVFSAGLDGVWQAWPLSERVPDVVKVGKTFYLAPLVPLVRRGEGVLVAYVGRERGDVYRLSDGRLEEVHEQFDEQPGRHDQGGWSQARYQRHIEKLVEDHLRGVAEELERQVRRRRGTGVVIVASEETRSALEDALSNDVSGAVIGWTSAEAHAGASELLETVKPLVDEWRAPRRKEPRRNAGRRRPAATGGRRPAGRRRSSRPPTVASSCCSSRKGPTAPAWECPSCGRASAEGGSCPLDGTQLEERQNGLDLAVHQTLAHGGTVCTLSARHDLEPVEGIGALLRY